MFRTIVCAAGMAALLAPAVRAQEALIAQVPFDFTIAGKVLSAGVYRISHEAGSPAVLKIMNEGRLTGAYLGVRNWSRSGGETSPKLVFNRYGGAYFLAAVEWGTKGCEAFVSKQEKELMARGMRPDKVILAFGGFEQPAER